LDAREIVLVRTRVVDFTRAAHKPRLGMVLLGEAKKAQPGFQSAATASPGGVLGFELAAAPPSLPALLQALQPVRERLAKQMYVSAPGEAGSSKGGPLEVFFENVRVPAANLIGEEGKGRRVGRCGAVSHDENTNADPGLAQCDSLFHAGHGEPARALGGEHPRYFHGPVAVRIRLHHTNDFNTGADGRTNPPEVLGDYSARYFGPGTEWYCFHTPTDVFHRC
jgi:hypothetical protein